MEMLNIANLDNDFAHSYSASRWSICKGFTLNILRVNLRELHPGILLEKLGGRNRYKIIDTCVAVKSRCVTRIARIA